MHDYYIIKMVNFPMMFIRYPKDSMNFADASDCFVAAEAVICYISEVEQNLFGTKRGYFGC
jgi:hypothetical protein